MLKICLFIILTNSLGHSSDTDDFSIKEEQSLAAKQLTYKFWKQLPSELQDDRFLNSNQATRKFQGASNLESRLIALLDGMYRLRCTGTLLSSRWIVTAAHCLKRDPEYAQSQALEKTARVSYAYKHGNHFFELSGKNEDVAMLQNDIGLVLAVEDFNIPNLPKIETYTRFLAAVKMDLILGNELVAFGFGRHAARAFARPLFVATLRGVPCKRHSWTPCFCGASTIAGACAGDSGGPVFFRGIQIGVTSLGPSRCLKYQGASHTVFTSLQPYASFIYKTIMSPIDQMLRTGGPNPHWLTPVFFSAPSTTSLPSTTRWTPYTIGTSSVSNRVIVPPASGGVEIMNFDFKLYFFVLVLFLFFVW